MAWKIGDRVKNLWYEGEVIGTYEDRVWVKFDTYRGEEMIFPIYDDDMVSDLEPPQ